MLKIACITLGGALGALCRALTSAYIQEHYWGSFPLGTFGVNSVGAFLIGFFWGFFESKLSIPPHIRLFVLTGFLGAFTTFATYSLETFQLLKGGDIKTALFNILISNMLCIFMVLCGYMASTRFGLFDYGQVAPAELEDYHL